MLLRYLWMTWIKASAWDFQQCGILTCVYSDEPVRTPFKLRNSKWCSASSLTIRILQRLAKALIRLRVCAGWSEALLVANTTLLEISCTGSFYVNKDMFLLFCNSVLIWFFYIPVNNVLVMSGQVFLGWTSNKHWLMCHAQGHNAATPVRLEPTTLCLELSTTTEPLRSPLCNSVRSSILINELRHEISNNLTFWQV